MLCRIAQRVVKSRNFRLRAPEQNNANDDQDHGGDAQRRPVLVQECGAEQSRERRLNAQHRNINDAQVRASHCGCLQQRAHNEQRQERGGGRPSGGSRGQLHKEAPDGEAGGSQQQL